MQKWMRSGLLSVGLAGAMVGGGAMVAHAQTNDSSSSSSDSGSSSTTSRVSRIASAERSARVRESPADAE